MSLEVIAVLRNYGTGTAAGALHRVRILSLHEFSGCCSILLCSCQSVSLLKLCSYRSQILLKANLQLVEEALLDDGILRQHTSAYVSIRQHTSAYLLDDRILSSTILPEELVGQHTRQRWLRIRGLTIRMHTLDAASLLSMPR